MHIIFKAQDIITPTLLDFTIKNLIAEGCEESEVFDTNQTPTSEIRTQKILIMIDQSKPDLHKAYYGDQYLPGNHSDQNDHCLPTEIAFSFLKLINNLTESLYSEDLLKSCQETF